jgi:spermidine synthase
MVERAASDFGTLWVVDEGDLRFLRSGAPDGPDQTVIARSAPERLEMPYLRAAALVFAARPAPERVLMIGLGGGGFVHYLRAQYPRAAIDAVEIDPVVVRLARDHFGLRFGPQLVAHVVDGAEFVERPGSTGAYDRVFLDAYHGDTIPPALARYAFLGRLSETLRHGGLVAANVGVRGREAFVKTFVSVFEHCVTLRARQDDNLVIVGSRGPSPSPGDVLATARTLDAHGAHEFRFETIARTIRSCDGSGDRAR